MTRSAGPPPPPLPPPPPPTPTSRASVEASGKRTAPAVRLATWSWALAALLALCAGVIVGAGFLSAAHKWGEGFVKVGEILERDEGRTASKVASTVGNVGAIAVIVTSLLFAVMWAGLATAYRRGSHSARIIGSVATILGAFTLFTFTSWFWWIPALIGTVAVWRPSSSMHCGRQPELSAKATQLSSAAASGAVDLAARARLLAEEKALKERSAALTASAAAGARNIGAKAMAYAEDNDLKGKATSAGTAAAQRGKDGVKWLKGAVSDRAAVMKEKRASHAVPMHACPPATPAGWYADTRDPRQLRWWDGTAWTEHRRPADRPPPPGACIPER